MRGGLFSDSDCGVGRLVGVVPLIRNLLRPRAPSEPADDPLVPVPASRKHGP
jgi:hypothetical protein